MNKRKIALFGGTFDPVHLGHTGVISAAAKTINADKVIFIPANQTAFKTHLPVASDHDRLDMIKLAIADYESFEVSNYELSKPTPAYTLDTVLYFKKKFDEQADIYWLIGSDCIEDLPRWYKIEQLIDRCRLCTMYRSGYERVDFSKFTNLWGAEKVRKLQENVIETPLIDINSTEIRQKLAKDQDVSDMLDGRVINYIREHHLYGY